MKFILLVHHDETAFEKMSEETKRGLLAESIRLCHQLEAKGEYLHASPVHPAATATLVQVRDGRSLVTDGPFIETREQMAGYFLIEAKDREEAVAIAGRVPGASIGTVEVRPVIEVAGLPE
ncbi:MAG: YCII domain-containing protein [Nitrospira sp.]|nr:YciI family protein [Nitrospira sp.]ULA61920.1 MAG: YCII domain-containing protein [Nitrospira sp.]